GHVFCSFLALVLKVELEQRIAALGEISSWPEILSDLDALTETTIEQDGKRFVVRSAPRPAASVAIRAIGLALPPTVRHITADGANPHVVPRHTWRRKLRRPINYLRFGTVEDESQAPAPFHVISRGRSGANLLAMVLYSKFGLHQPLNRQSAEYAKEGIDLPLSTLADHVGACAAVLQPLVDLIRAHVFAGERIHGDE